MDSRLTYARTAAQTDDFRRAAARHLKAREDFPSRETRRHRPRPLASLATTLHIHRPSLRFLRG